MLVFDLISFLLQVYQNIGLKDKERYNRELKEYKERLKLRQGEGANS